MTAILIAIFGIIAVVGLWAEHRSGRLSDRDKREQRIRDLPPISDDWEGWGR